MSYKIVLFVLALVLTIFAGTAKAQSDLCPPGSKDTTLPATICGVAAEIDVCYICPTDDLTLSFEIHLIAIRFPTLPPPPGCDWKTEVEGFLSNWNLITMLCPGWGSLRPCNDYFEKHVYFKWPLCWRYYRDLSGQTSIEPCLPVECYCIGDWKYCYDVDHIETVWVIQTIVADPLYGGPCPPTGDCAMFTAANVPWNRDLGTYSPCFHICQ